MVVTVGIHNIIIGAYPPPFPDPWAVGSGAEHDSAQAVISRLESLCGNDVVLQPYNQQIAADRIVFTAHTKLYHCKSIFPPGPLVSCYHASCDIHRQTVSSVMPSPTIAMRKDQIKRPQRLHWLSRPGSHATRSFSNSGKTRMGIRMPDATQIANSRHSCRQECSLGTKARKF